MNDFSAAMQKARSLVSQHHQTAAVMVRLNSSGEPTAWSAQLATQQTPDQRYIVAGYVSVTGLVRAAHEAFSRAQRQQVVRG